MLSSARWKNSVQQEHERAEEQHAAVADLADREVGDERPDERTDRAARRDDAEQALALLLREQLEQEAPEHRHDEQVQHADEHVEERARRDVALIGLQHQADDGERDGDAAVDPGQEHAAAGTCRPGSRRSG